MAKLADQPLVEALDLGHSYRSARGEVEALHGVDLVARDGEVLGVLGPTGSGKTTLIRLLAAAMPAARGSLRVAGYDLAAIGAAKGQRYRREIVGCQWQQASAAFWPGLSALENVQVPMLARPAPAATRRDRALELLQRLGLADEADLDPWRLSTMAQRRLALAIAFANAPRLLLCDEPTAELDEPAAGELVDELVEVLRDLGSTAIIATHDAGLARRLDGTVRLGPVSDG